MNNIYIEANKVCSFVIGHQGDHKANNIVFTDFDISYQTDLYIALSYTNTNGEVEDVMYPLMHSDVGYELPIGHPLTDNFGEIKAQIVRLILTSEDEEEYCKCSNVFTMVVLESVTKGDIASFSENPVLENFLYAKIGKATDEFNAKVDIINNFNWDELHQNKEMFNQKVEEIDTFEQNMTDSFNDLSEDVQEFKDRVESLLTNDILYESEGEGASLQTYTLNNSIENYKYVDITVETTKQVQRFEVVNGIASGKIDILYRANQNIWQLNTEDFVINGDSFVATNGYYLNIDYRNNRYDSNTQYVKISKIVGVK